MAGNTTHDMIKDITQAKETWRINGRIIYSWEQTWGDEGVTSNIDFIIIDSKGTKIQATIAKRLFFKHKSMVKDGELRFITNFSISQNTGEYRITKHQYKIVFTVKTIFSPTTDVIIPESPIEFASFNDIIHNNLDARYLVDIIGELHAKGPVEKTSKDKRTMLIELIDCEGQKIIMTLWEKLADQMANATTEFDKSEHRPSHCYNQICQDNKKFKILLDAEIPEVRNFIKRKIDVGLKSSSSSTILTSYCESVANELLDLSARRTIDEIRKIQEEGYFVTLATITAIDTEFKWYIENIMLAE